MVINCLQMGLCSSNQSAPSRKIKHQNPENPQKPTKSKEIKEDTQTDNTWKERINKISFEDSNGNCYTLSNLLEDDSNNEKILLKSNEKGFEDKRKKACCNCIETFPANCIGVIQATDSENKFHSTSTAFMISPQLALTTAHTFVQINPYTQQPQTVIPKMIYVGLLGECVLNNPNNFNHKHFFRVEDFRVHPKYESGLVQRWKMKRYTHENEMYLKREEIEKLGKRAMDLLHQTQEYDYAIIKLSTKAQNKEYLQLKVMGDQLRTQDVTVQGYMLKEPEGKPAFFEQYYDTDSVISLTSTAINYKVDTKEQQSGSPVMYKTPSDEIVVVGVHKGYNKTLKCNLATRITFEMMDVIKKWSQEMNVEFPVADSAISGPKSGRIQNEDEFNRRLREILKKKEEEHARQIQQVKVRKKIAEEKVQTAERDLQSARRRLQKQTGENSQRKKELEEKQDRIRGLEAQVEESRTDLKSERRPANPNVRPELKWDQQSFHVDKFSIEGRVAAFKEGKQKYQIVSDRYLQGSETIKLAVRKYGAESCIAVGIINDIRLKDDFSGEQRHSIGLLSYPKHSRGILKVNGAVMQSFNPKWFLPIDKEVVIQVDLNAMTVEIKVDGGNKASFQLPQNFQEPSKVYVYAMMGSAGDSVEML